MWTDWTVVGVSSVLYWLPFNEVLRAPCSLLGIAKSPVCPWACMGKMGAFSVVRISHLFPYDKLSQTLLNYHMMHWDLCTSLWVLVLREMWS